MKVLAFPRDDATPYQRLLYGEMRGLGVRIRYAGGLTRSHTLNLLLLPVELAAGRMARVQFVHLHWVFAFAFPGSRRFRALRRLSQAWFVICLRTIRILGMRLIWTAHNVLPHEPVFADDLAARRALVAFSDLVITHSRSALDELATLGASPRAHAVIAHGPLSPSALHVSLRVPGSGEGPRQLLFFGRLNTYKGVEDLLEAFMTVHADNSVHLTVAGECTDPALRRRLESRALACGGQLVLRFARVPDEEVTQLLAAADGVVLPFRRVTTSGSAILALSHGRPLVVPDLAAFNDLPDEAVVRYDGTVRGLSRAMAQVANADGATLASMSAAAGTYAAATTWGQIAAQTTSEMTALLSGEQQGEQLKRVLAAP